MFSVRSCQRDLFQRIRLAVEPLGFVLNESQQSFSRTKNGVLQTISIPLDLRGDMDVVAVTANLSVCACPESPTTCLSRCSERDTLTVNVGYLMDGHQWHEWELDVTSASDRMVADMVAKVTRYGMPWFETLSDHDTVRHQLRRGRQHDVAPMSRMPVMFPVPS